LKLALGTAQFGQTYGIANNSGQVSRESAKEIIDLARAKGIDTLDTAIAYGDSETCLGQVGVQGCKVITKLPAMPEKIDDVGGWVRNQIDDSLLRLNVTSVYGVLLHRSQELMGPKASSLYQALARLKADTLVSRVGVSIYAPSELDNLIDAGQIDLVQAPFNLFDQRMETSGWLKKLHEAEIEVHTRSTFLQGLLLMPATKIPEKFQHWRALFNTWHRWLLNNDISATQACISFVQSHPEISRVVVGVEKLEQLEQLVQAAKEQPNITWPDVSCSDEQLINPSNWNLL
jgi:hypothetical protein